MRQKDRTNLEAPLIPALGLLVYLKVGMFLPQIGESAIRENILYIVKEAEKEGTN